jgi:hypothetical protein
MPINQSTADAPEASSNNPTVSAPAAPDIAFQARVVSKDAPAVPAEDSFVPVKLAPVAPVVEDSPRVATQPHADTTPRHEDPQIDKPAPLPEPEVVDSPAPVYLEPAARPIPIETNHSPSPDAFTEAPQAPPPQQPEIVKDPHPVQPVRDLSVRLTADSQHIDVKLTDRGGELHVAVRSADPVLSTDLRSRLDELVGGLDRSGFRAEAWHSGDAQHGPITPVSSTSDQPQFQSGGDPRQQGRNVYQPDQPGPRRGRDHAAWLAQFDALAGAGKGE